MTATRDRPWHLVPREERAFALWVLEDLSKYHKPLTAESFRSAAQALREATPYPDEALVFECLFDDVLSIGTVVEMAGIGEAEPEDRDSEDPHRWFIRAKSVEEEDDGFWWYFRLGSLRPLTPGAAEALEYLTRREGGRR